MKILIDDIRLNLLLEQKNNLLVKGLLGTAYYLHYHSWYLSCWHHMRIFWAYQGQC